MLHDTHVHLDLLIKKLGIISGDLAPLIKDHEFLIQSTVSGKNYIECKTLFKEFNNVFYLLGCHPEEVKIATDINELIRKHSMFLQEEISYSKLVGIGEIGLDYYHSDNKLVHHRQAKLFESHLDLAVKYNLPTVIHIRDPRGERLCMQDSLAILKNFPSIHGKFVVHCFSGNQLDADQILGMGGFLGFGGITTFSSGLEQLEIAKNCPTDKLVLETDLPFLSPIPKRGDICLPEYIRYVCAKISESKSIDTEQLWMQSKLNSNTLFSRLALHSS
jgi:TatD DNase family protein